MASRPLSLRRYTHDEARADIRDSGHQILSASDVEEALSISRSLQHIDALLTDIYLKKSDPGRFRYCTRGDQISTRIACAYTTGNFITDTMKALFVEGTH
jgi:hypothetical protein